MHACRRGDLNFTEILLARGAKLDLISLVRTFFSLFQESPLPIATAMIPLTNKHFIIRNNVKDVNLHVCTAGGKDGVNVCVYEQLC